MDSLCNINQSIRQGSCALLGEVQRFLAVMDLFRRATGQALSVPKTVLLLLGALPSELQPAASPAAIAGIRVVGEARVLGVKPGGP